MPTGQRLLVKKPAMYVEVGMVVMVHQTVVSSALVMVKENASKVNLKTA